MNIDDAKLILDVNKLIIRKNELEKELAELKAMHNFTIQFYENEIQLLSKVKRFKVKKRGA